MPEQAKKKTAPEASQSTTAPAAAVPLQPQIPTFTRVPDFKSFYANFVQTSVTPFDISMQIGETAGVDHEGKFVVELKARISMSPLEAKIVINLLVTAIMQYEAQFGKIVVPPGIGLPTEENDKTKGVQTREVEQAKKSAN